MIIAFGVIGLIIISFAVWVKNERNQNILFVAGGILLLLYSMGIKNLIFSILQAVFVTSAFIEFLKKKR